MRTDEEEFDHIIDTVMTVGDLRGALTLVLDGYAATLHHRGGPGCR